MKMKTRLFALATVAAMAFSGCGTSDSGSAAVASSPEELLANATKVMNEVDSYNAQMVMDFSMSMGEEKMDMTTTADMVAFQNPVKMKMDMTMDMAEESTTIPMYFQQTDEEMISYTYMEGYGWMATKVDMSAMDQYNATDNVMTYLEIMSDVKANGTETISGVNTTRIDGVISGEAMSEAVESSGMLGSLTNMGITEEDALAIYEAMGGMTISMWIGDDGYVYKYEFDMSDMMQQVMDKTMEALGEMAGEMKINVDKANMIMTCSDFNNAADFEIPAEALEAEVMEY